MSDRTDAEPRLDLLVHRMTWEADGVLSVELVHPDGEPLPAWAPGAHLDLHAGGHVRQYSLCGDPGDPGRYRIGVLDEPGSRGGSRYVHNALRPGAPVTVQGPRNHFPLVPGAAGDPAGADGYIFVAGGIGITPLLAMAREAARAGIPWHLVHGGRRRDAMAFGDELTALAAGSVPVDAKGNETGSTALGEVTFHPQDELGHIDLDSALAGLGEGTHVYCCGPEPLLAAVEERCAALGVGARLHVERFAAPVVERTGDETAFEVECRRSGSTVLVDSGSSVIDALENIGIEVPSSCREGICGTCETRVLEGTPEHRDFLLSEAEHGAGETMMVCVSRCSSERLVLDL